MRNSVVRPAGELQVHYLTRLKRLQQPKTNVLQYNNNNNRICRALFTKRPGALTETSDDMLCEIVQSLNGA